MQREPLVPMTLKEVLEYEQTEGVWLIDKLLPQYGVGILSGEAGTYKTWLLLSIAMAVASGQSLFNEFPVNQGNVLMIDEENRIQLLSDRLKMLQSSKELPIYFMVKTGFNLSAGDGWIDVLKMHIARYNIKFITLDSFVRMHDGEENEARHVSEFFRKLGKVQGLGVTILMTHHHRKEMSGQPSRPSQALRGSSDIRAAVDTHIAVYSQNKGEIKVVQTKSRDAEAIDPFILKVESEDERIQFVYSGEAQGTTKVEAKKMVVKLLTENSEMSRADLVKAVKEVAGANATGQAIKELGFEKFISVRIEGANKKFYSLVNPE